MYDLSIAVPNPDSITTTSVHLYEHGTPRALGYNTTLRFFPHGPLHAHAK